MQASTNSIYNHPSTPKPPTPPPSVPLSVYRELADELQTAQARLDALTAKNQQLTQENKLLRQEITKLIQSCLRLQKLVDFPAPPTIPNDQAPRTSPDVKSAAAANVNKAHPRQQGSRPRQPAVSGVAANKNQRSQVPGTVMEMMSSIPQPVLIEEQEVKYYPPTEPKTKEVSGWWLLITILLIMLSAFTAGYLVVRPLFEHQSR
jgi:hypothetical protein